MLGKHTDYAGGNSLVMALDVGATVEVAPAVSGITARSTAMPGQITLGAGLDLPDGHWGRYLQATVTRLVRNFGALSPCTVTVTSTLPLASGMSSSSALVVASALALARFNGLDGSERWNREISSPADLALYLASIENGATFGTLAGDAGVGTFGGSEDHTAMVCARAGHLSQFRFGPTRRICDVPLGEEWVFVVANSGVLAEKTGAARERYNQASLAVAEILARWNRATGRADASLGMAIDSSGDAPDRMADVVVEDAVLATRLRHFLAESETLVPAGTKALAQSDFAALGDICAESQAIADRWLANQTPETNRLAALARELGASASSSFGAGFGGSVWALVRTAGAASFAEDWLSRYRSEYPARAAASLTLVSSPSGPTRELLLAEEPSGGVRDPEAPGRTRRADVPSDTQR